MHQMRFLLRFLFGGALGVLFSYLLLVGWSFIRWLCFLQG